ncbi:hypothetical protein DM02DRAFT_396375 [Periconia macrospinosa]|uniref:Uncharacterized protein n=1 Tax=Periconia macrospinosa TaxID=97972 RepID=A0A2V1DSW0_9PLEO|nr:hypothetical protein DM02DRAFT_396375 [Periconia macrospinosa]
MIRTLQKKITLVSTSFVCIDTAFAAIAEYSWAFQWSLTAKNRVLSVYSPCFCSDACGARMSLSPLDHDCRDFIVQLGRNCSLSKIYRRIIVVVQTNYATGDCCCLSVVRASVERYGKSRLWAGVVDIMACGKGNFEQRGGIGGAAFV